MSAKDYNLLARAVACPTCFAIKGSRCFGARMGTRIKGTHWKRRAAATEVRREEDSRARLAR